MQNAGCEFLILLSELLLASYQSGVGLHARSLSELTAETVKGRCPAIRYLRVRREMTPDRLRPPASGRAGRDAAGDRPDPDWQCRRDCRIQRHRAALGWSRRACTARGARLRAASAS